MADFNNITIRDFNVICRFCLKKDEHLKPIFKLENNGGGSNDGEIVDFFNENAADGAIVQMINLCTGLETTSSDGLPLFICNQCFDKLSSSNSFRRQCISSVEFLKKIRSGHGIKSEIKSSNYDDNETGNDFVDEAYPDDIKEESDADDRLHDITVEPLCLLDDKSPASKKKRKTPQKYKRRKSISESSDEDFKPPPALNDDHIGDESNDDEDYLPVKSRKSLPTKSSKTAKVPKALKAPKAPKTPKTPKTPKIKKEKVKKEPKEKLPKVNKTEQCEVCGFISRSLKTHMLTHTQQKNYECDFCGKKFSLRASLKNHLFAHINIRPYKCDMCTADFIDKAVYRRHLDKHTRTNYKYSCEHCGKQFRRRFCLDKHVLTHTQVRRHACNYCQQMFLSIDGLRNHEGIHTGERRFKCGLCPMAYNFNSSASAHRRQHLIDGEFHCEKCNYSVKFFGTFKAHMVLCMPGRLVV